MQKLRNPADILIQLQIHQKFVCYNVMQLRNQLSK